MSKTDQIWGASPSDLRMELDEHYGVEGLWLFGDYHHEERDELLYDVLVYWHDGEEHFITDGVPMLGHGPSGAAGVDQDDLPSEETVQSVVEAAKDGDRDD